MAEKNQKLSNAECFSLNTAAGRLSTQQRLESALDSVAFNMPHTISKMSV